ncbi:DUF1989 domain-containing protein [Methylobacterium sp. JK268]
MTESLVTIPARSGKAAFVATGETVTVVNTHGEQVVDTWAFNRDDLTEFMSMEHSRAHMLRLVPRPGDVMRTNRRRPILTWLDDTSGGVHDTLIAACDRHRYAFLGHEGHHDNCADNLVAGLAELGLAPPEIPSPLNLFMNIPWDAEGRLAFAAPPRPVPGGFVTFRAEMDLVIAFSACPQDILPINGKAARPVEAHFRVG